MGGTGSVCFIKCYFFLFFQVSPCLTMFLFLLLCNRKISVKLYMPNLLRFHLCSCSFIVIRLTSYKKHADFCKERRRHKYHTNNKMHTVEQPSRESQSCLLDTQITYGHTNTLITKLGGIEQILGKALL